MTAAEKQILREVEARDRKVVEESNGRPFDLCVTGGAEFTVIRDLARAMEAEGDTPVITRFRDEHNVIVGVKLVGHLAKAGKS